MTKTVPSVPTIINPDDLPLDGLYQACEEAVTDGMLMETLTDIVGGGIPPEIDALMREVVRATIEVTVKGTVDAVNTFLANKTNQ